MIGECLPSYDLHLEINLNPCGAALCLRLRVWEIKPLGRSLSATILASLFSSLFSPPHKTSLLKHRALVHNSTEKETLLAWDLRDASASDGYQSLARGFPALWRNPSRQ